MTVTRSGETLMRERYEMDGNVNLFFSYVVIGVLVAVLVGEVSTSRLLTWAVLTSIVVPVTHVARRVSMSFETWLVVEALTQAITGAAWGSIALLALPDSQVHQALLVAVLIGVLVASSSGESQFHLLYIAFMVPFSGTAIAGYLLPENGMEVCALFLAVAFTFSMFLAHGHRRLHHGFVDLLMTNEQLVAELGAERDAMAEANRRLDRIAWTDSLTGLANRAAMNRRLADLLPSLDEGSGPVTVAYLDLNGFKSINDSYGHRIGDLVLISVAKRLDAAMKDNEVSYRLGGDELIVLSNTSDLDEFGRRLAAKFDEPIMVNDHCLMVGASIGITTVSTPCSADELMLAADQALYRNKENSSTGTRYEIGRSPDSDVRHVPDRHGMSTSSSINR